MDRPTVFISYSHRDEVWKDRLAPQLGVLEQQGHLDLWTDREIGAGEDWYQKIQGAMSAASVAVLLVSANSLTSDFILREEVTRLLQHRDKEGLHIFPVIIRPCDWEAVPWLSQMQLRPRDGRPISGGNEHQIDADLAAIAKEIRLLLKGTVQRSGPQQWIPVPPAGISIARLPVTGEHLFGRKLEMDLLDGAWADEGVHVLSLVAWGGVGKSALVNHWIGEMGRDHFRGARRVYGWSFYSQGSRETAASADLFMDAALRWFGDVDPTAGSPWDKGERLARLVRQERALLILDGVEPLQYPPGPDGGRLRDPALAALVRELATASSGLCVITTRHRVADVEHLSRSTAPVIELEHLSDVAGAELLRALGVQGPEEELKQASREFRGHGLALNLLGAYLRDVFSGDVRCRSEVRLLEEDEEQGGHARRVMTSYEKWFGDGPELSVLRMIGLFDRPAGRELIDVLRAPPAIAGFTDSLFHHRRRSGFLDLFRSKEATPLSDIEWKQALARLRRARLLTDADLHDPNTIDAHPLVREHFGQQLREGYPDAWREGNNRLYEHLKRTTKELPDTIEEMGPLYAAVAHGCQASRHQEALNEVFWRRIQRGNEGFSWKKLGVFGADLTALSGFFDPPWRQPVTGLAEAFKAFVLNEAGICLRALGRLAEAVQPMQAGLEARISQKAWKNAAIIAGNLSELHLTIGDLAQALEYAKQSVNMADRSGDAFERMAMRTTLADALHQAGRLTEAKAAFRESEEMQKERQPEYPLLYSLQGFQYCDLLLDQGECREVLSRAGQALKWATQQEFLLDIALDHLSLGLAHLLQAQREGTGDFSGAADHLDRAVDGLRQAGQQQELPRGLLARAGLHRVRGAFERAQRDLDEAMTIATRGGMGLHQADGHLEYARLHIARGEKDQARERLNMAKEMIGRMGYHRWDREVRELEGQF